MKNYGYHYRGLYIDLSKVNYTVKSHYDSSSVELYNQYIGGRGLGVKLVAPFITNDSLSPEMPIVLASGPLNGTNIPTSGRGSIVSKSPLTNTIFDASVGGKFPNTIKKAGYDYIFIQGKSPSPVLIKIQDEVIEFIPVQKWDSTEEFYHKFKESYDKRWSVGCIGAAAWNGCLFASLVFDGHYFAGRGGLGLVWATKNLQGIIISGSNNVLTADKEGSKKAREDILRLLRASPAIFGKLGISEFGTPALVDLIATRRMMPTRNFQQTFFPSYRNFSGYSWNRLYQTKKNACSSCPIACKKITDTGQVIPEYETVSHFSALIQNEDQETVIEANALCNQFGMDTITAASTLACYSEIQDKALDKKTILSLLTDIAFSRGEGELLKKGSARYSYEMAKPESSMSIKNLEMPAYDPRGAYGMALGYCTSNRGGCHLRSYPISYEILRKPIALDRFTFSAKSRVIKISEDLNAIIDSLVACKFAFFGASLEEYAKAYTAITGIKKESQHLLQDGERIVLFERWINSQLGFTRKDDKLPDRFFMEEGSSGDHISINPIDKAEFEKALDIYYACRGCDRNGVPLPEKLQQLGIV